MLHDVNWYLCTSWDPIQTINAFAFCQMSIVTNNGYVSPIVFVFSISKYLFLAYENRLRPSIIMGRPFWRLRLLRLFNYKRQITTLKQQSKDYLRQVRHLKDEVATIVKQMNDSSLAFLEDQRRHSRQLVAEANKITVIEKLDASVQTDADWTTHLAEEIRIANARRFKAEALLYSANLPMIRADFMG